MSFLPSPHPHLPRHPLQFCAVVSTRDRKMNEKAQSPWFYL